MRKKNSSRVAVQRSKDNIISRVMRIVMQNGDTVQSFRVDRSRTRVGERN